MSSKIISHKKDSSVSSVIGTIVLLALVVTSTAIVAVTVISSINDTAQVGPIISFEASANPYMLYNAGGEAINWENTKIYYKGLDITGYSYIGMGDIGNTPVKITTDPDSKGVYTYNVYLWNTGEAVLPHDSDNAPIDVSEIMILSTAQGQTTPIYIGSKYEGGIIIPDKPKHTVTTTLTGFRTTSNMDDIDTNIIFDTNSKIGVIVELSGDGTSYVSDHPSVSITDPNIGSLTFWKKSGNEYLYYIEKNDVTSQYYKDGIINANVSGTVSFNDGVSPDKSFSGSVNIPPEADLTFKVGTYAKYLTGAYGGGTVNNYYVGHGITVEITGGSRASDVVPINNVANDNRLDYKIEVTLKKNVNNSNKLTSGTNYNGDANTLKEDYNLSKGNIKYYHIINADGYRFPFDAAEYNISIKFSDKTTKEYTFNSNNGLVSSIIEYHIPAWSPLYEDVWYKQPDTELKPFDTEIKTYVSGDGEIADRGIIVSVNNGYFPDKLFLDKKNSSTDSVYPVKIESVILKDGDNTITLSAKDADAVKSINNNIDYYFTLSSFKNGEAIEDAIVNVTFTMEEKINKDDPNVRSRSYRYIKDGIDVGGIDLENDYINVKVEGYQKLLEYYLNNGLSDIANNSRGHGLKFTVEIDDPSMITQGSYYYLDVSFINGDTEYGLSDDNINKATNRTVFEKNIGQKKSSNLRVIKITETETKNMMQITNTTYSHELFGNGIYYYYISPSNKDYSNSAFDNPSLKVDLYVGYDKKTAKRIGTIFDTTDSTRTDDISVPARDLLLENYTIKGDSRTINGVFSRGLCLTMYADLSEINSSKEISVKYRVNNAGDFIENTQPPEKTEGNADYYYFPIYNDPSAPVSVTDIEIKVKNDDPAKNDFVIPIYNYATRLKIEKDSTKINIIELPTA